MSDRVVKMVVAYDGTDFCGWQRQAGSRTVQEELEKALATMHGHAVPVVGAGRTDSGVHAAGQVAHFHTDIATIPADRFEPALNRLPPDVRVVRASDAHPDFHARFDARFRRYKYLLYHPPGGCPTSTDTPGAFSGGRTRRGSTGWRPACAASSTARRSRPPRIPARTVSATSTTPRSTPRATPSYSTSPPTRSCGAWCVRWSAPSSSWRLPARRDGHAGDILEARDRERAGTTAPARGLFLWNVAYDEAPKRAQEPRGEEAGRAVAMAAAMAAGARRTPALGA